MSKEELVLTKREIDDIIFILNTSRGISHTANRIKAQAKQIADYKNNRLKRTDISQRKIINLILNNTTIMAHGIFKEYPEMAKSLRKGKGRAGRTEGQRSDRFQKRYGRQSNRGRPGPKRRPR